MTHIGLAVRSRFEILRDNLTILAKCSHLNHGTEIKVQNELATELKLFGALRKQVFEPPIKKRRPRIFVTPPPVVTTSSWPLQKESPKTLTLDEKRRLLAPVSYHEERSSPFKLLWVKVIIRAAYDYALWRNSRDLRQRKYAQDAERWLFESSTLFNSLESICFICKLPIENFRRWARELTRDQVKKFEFLERSGKDPVAVALAKQHGLLDDGEHQSD